MFGGTLLLTALSTALAGALLTDAMRHIVFGAVVLCAILALQERAARKAPRKQKIVYDRRFAMS